MTKQRLLIAAAVTTGALALFAAGCLGSDPDVNSQIYNAKPDGPISGMGGGSGGSGGPGPNGPIVGLPLATFDTSVDGFSLNAYHETSGAQHNLGDPKEGASPAPRLSMDSALGNPEPGSLQVTAPFSGANQYVDIQNTVRYGTSNPVDWRGGTMHVRVKADDGTFSGVAQPYVITTSGYHFGGTSTPFDKSSDWQEYTVVLDMPGHFDAGYDAKAVVIFGLQLNSGSDGASQKPVTFHIDSFSLEGVAAPPPPDAGPDAGPTISDAGPDTSDAGPDDATTDSD